jgi:hypothetical protein
MDAKAVECSRCGRQTSDPNELAGSWYAIDGGIVCPACATLDDMRAVQDERDDIVCVGCGSERDLGADYWRAYKLGDEQAGRALLEVGGNELAFVCPTCEPWVIHGIPAQDG